jgi:hypothetical protein
MLCNAALMVRLSNFYSSFKPNFSRIFFFFEFQVVRESNRSTFEGPLYFGTKRMLYCQQHSRTSASHFPMKANKTFIRRIS